MPITFRLEITCLKKFCPSIVSMLWLAKQYIKTTEKPANFDASLLQTSEDTHSSKPVKIHILCKNEKY